MRNLRIKKSFSNSVTEKQRMVVRYFETWQKRCVAGYEDRYLPFTDEEVEHIRLLNDHLTHLTIEALEKANRICDDMERQAKQGNKDYKGYKMKVSIKMNGHQFLMDDPDDILQRIHYAKNFELAELKEYSLENRHDTIERLKKNLTENSEQACWEYSQLHDEHGIHFCEAFYWFTNVNCLFPLEDIMLLQPDNFKSNIEINI